MPGMIKIGHTKKVEAELRASELSQATGVPLPFKVELSWIVEHPMLREAEAHRKLRQYRVAASREFFKIDVDRAESIINTVLYGTSSYPELLVEQVKTLQALYFKHPDAFSNARAALLEIKEVLRKYRGSEIRDY